MFIINSSDKIYELKINSDKFYPNHAEIEFRIRILIKPFGHADSYTFACFSLVGDLRVLVFRVL